MSALSHSLSFPPHTHSLLSLALSREHSHFLDIESACVSKGKGESESDSKSVCVCVGEREMERWGESTGGKWFPLVNSNVPAMSVFPST